MLGIKVGDLGGDLDCESAFDIENINESLLYYYYTPDLRTG
jgi:hypothetical protein